MQYYFKPVIIGLALVLTTQIYAQGNARGTIGESPYNVIRHWADPFQEDGFGFGGNSGVWAESADRIIIAQRGETVLPHPVPEDFPGYAGVFGINVLRETNRRTWQNCLYVVNGDVVKETPVKTGLRKEGYIQILEGITMEDEIVKDGAGFLTDSSIIEIIN